MNEIKGRNNISTKKVEMTTHVYFKEFTSMKVLQLCLPGRLKIFHKEAGTLST